MRILRGGATADQYFTPDIYIEEQTPVAPAAPGGYTSTLLAIIGEFQKGPVDAPIKIEGLADFTVKCGGFLEDYPGSKAAYAALQRGVQRMVLINLRGAGATKADIELLDKLDVPTLRIEHKYPTAYGNTCSAEVRAGTAAGTFCIILRAPLCKPEVYDNLTTLQEAIQKINSLSQDFVAADLLSASAAPDNLPDLIAETKLSGGSDGAAPGATVYLGTSDPVTGRKTGLELLKTVPGVTDFTSDAFVSEAFNAAMVEAAEEMNSIAYLPTPPTASVSSATATRQSYDSEFAHLVLGHAKSKSKAWWVPVAVYDAVAHVLTPVQDGTSGYWYSDIEATDVPLSDADIETLTASQVVGMWFSLNEEKESVLTLKSDFTLSKTKELQQTYRRRVTSLIERDYAAILAPYRDKHISSGLLKDVELVTRSYLDGLKGRSDQPETEVIQSYTISFLPPESIGHVDEFIEDLRIDLYNIANKIRVRLLTGANVA